MVEEIINVKDINVHGFSNSTIRSGKTGSGKTTAGEFEVENLYMFRGCKILDFDSSGRFENCSYSIPEDDSRMLMYMQNFPDLHTNWKYEPMGFDDEVLLFCGRNLYSYPQLPKNFRVVSFKLEDISIDILRRLLGGTESLGHTLNSFQLKYGFEVNMQDVWDVLFTNEFRGNRTMFRVSESQKNMIKVRIQSWLQTGLFNDKVEKIDLLQVFKDNKRISCFNSALTFTQDEEQIAYSIVLEKAVKFMIKRLINHRLVFHIREIHDYNNWDVCAPLINQLLRKGRTLGRAGIDVICDTQRPIDLKPVIRRQFSFYMQLQGDYKDAEKMQEIRYIPKQDLERVTRFGVGKGMLVVGHRYDVPIEFPPTRHKHVSPNSDILKLLGDKHGWRDWDAEEIFVGLTKEYGGEEEVVEQDDESI